MVFPFQAKGKLLYFAAAAICIVFVIFIPVGLVFIYMALKAEIRMDDDTMTYQMLRKRVIPYSEISSITTGRTQKPAYYMQTDAGGHVAISFATVIPLRLELKTGKKVKMSLNYFASPQRILEVLREKTGLEVSNENGEAVGF